MRSGALRFLWHFGQMGAIRIAAQALSFVLALLLARALGAEGYGFYAFTLTIFMILEPIAGGGLGTLATRDVATHDENMQVDGIAIARILYSALVFSVLISILVTLAAWAFEFLERGSKTQYMIWGLLLLPAAILIETTRGILTGQMKILWSQFLTQNVRTIIPIFLVGGIWLYSGIGVNLSPNIAFAAMSISGFIVGAWALLINRRPISLKFREVMEFTSVKLTLLAALPFGILTALQYLYTRTDILMVGTLMTPTDVGHYQIALRLGAFVAVPASLVGLILAPRFAKLHKDGQTHKLRKIFWLGQIPAILSSLIVVGFLIVCGSPFIELAFGKDFLPASQPLIIIALGQALICFNALSTQLMVMAKQEGKIVYIVTATVIGNFSLNYFLIPLYGTVGAATATTTMSFVTVFMISWSLYRSGLLRRHSTRAE